MSAAPPAGGCSPQEFSEFANAGLFVGAATVDFAMTREGIRRRVGNALDLWIVWNQSMLRLFSQLDEAMPTPGASCEGRPFRARTATVTRPPAGGPLGNQR